MYPNYNPIYSVMYVSSVSQLCIIHNFYDKHGQRIPITLFHGVCTGKHPIRPSQRRPYCKSFQNTERIHTVNLNTVIYPPRWCLERTYWSKEKDQ